MGSLNIILKVSRTYRTVDPDFHILYDFPECLLTSASDGITGFIFFSLIIILKGFGLCESLDVQAVIKIILNIGLSGKCRRPDILR